MNSCCDYKERSPLSPLCDRLSRWSLPTAAYGTNAEAPATEILRNPTPTSAPLSLLSFSQHLPYPTHITVLLSAIAIALCHGGQGLIKGVSLHAQALYPRHDPSWPPERVELQEAVPAESYALDTECGFLLLSPPLALDTRSWDYKMMDAEALGVCGLGVSPANSRGVLLFFTGNGAFCQRPV